MASLAAACGGEPSAAGAPPAPSPAAWARPTAGRTATSAAASTSSPSGPTCTGANPHDAHAASGFGCQVCHAAGGVLAFTTVTFPGGATTAGGTVTPAGEATTCSVGCHAPLGATPQPIAWNAGPLECTSCHTNVAPADGAAVRSSHFVGGTTPSASCESCHDLSGHMQGEVRIVNGDGTTTSGTCVECHSGQGLTMAGATPPLLLGWNDVWNGDFHGARPGTCRFDALDPAGVRSVGKGALPCPANQPASPNALRITSRWWYATGCCSGAWAMTCDIEPVDPMGTPIGPKVLGQPCPQGTILNYSCNNPATHTNCYPTTLVTRGFGGALLPPYDRGQGALSCATCHDFHYSSNALLLASRVNGVVLPPGTIDRAGVGAQALCNACHVGERHEVCKSCHKEAWVTDGEYSWFEGAPVDPAGDGAACFFCHGHEGILQMRDKSPQWPGDGHPFRIAGHSRDAIECSHCHSAWASATEYVPPTFYTAWPSVTRITATTATVSWDTYELATTWVEYGIGTAGYVAGDGAFVRQHSVVLTGLTPASTYAWRIRTADRFQNVTETPLSTFATPGPEDVPYPDLGPVDSSASVGTYQRDVDLVWFPVVAPSGTAVEYEVQLATDPGFTYLDNGFMAGPGVPGTTVGDSGWTVGAPTTSGGRPALSFPATLTGIPQDDCTGYYPNVYYWRVRARDQAGHVSGWSPTGSFEVFAGDRWC